VINLSVLKKTKGDLSEEELKTSSMIYIKSLYIRLKRTRMKNISIHSGIVSSRIRNKRSHIKEKREKIWGY